MSELLDGSSIPAPDQPSAAVWPPQLPVQPPRAPHVRPVPGTRVTRNDGLHTGKDDGRLSVALRRLSSSLLGSLDKVISRAAALDPAATTFFSEGTGDLERLRVHEAEFLNGLLENKRPPRLDVEWLGDRISVSDSRARVRNARFLSPLAHLLPPEARMARIQLISHAVPPHGAVRGVVLHFAATADQTYVLRRRLLAEPLLHHGIVSVVLCPAFYGARRPDGQNLHFTRTLTDFCLLTHSMITEGHSLLDWMQEELTGKGREFEGARLGLTGVSMGGAMAGVVAAMSLCPLAISPCLATWTGAGVYTRGGLAPLVAWDVLAAEPRVRQMARERFGGDAHAAARAWVREVLEHNDVDVIVAALTHAAPSRPSHAARTLVMVNAVDDGYVDASEAQHLFSVLAPTCAPGDAVHRWIAGGHATSVLVRTDTFVRAVVESFDLLDRRLASQAPSQHAPRARL